MRKGFRLTILLSTLSLLLAIAAQLGSISAEPESQAQSNPWPKEFSFGGYTMGVARQRMVPKQETKFGVATAAGKVILEPSLDSALPFHEGLACVSKDKKFGFIDTAGKFKIPMQFDVAGNFSEGLAPAAVSGKYGFIDRTGKFVIPPKFVEAREFSEGLACIADSSNSGSEKKYGFIDKFGTVVIPPKYKLGGSFRDGVAQLLEDDPGKGWSYIDKEGNLLFRRSNSGHFSEGLAPFNTISTGPTTWGYMDKTGKDAIEPKFFLVQGFSEGLGLVFTGEPRKAGFVDHSGNYVIAPTFDSATPFSEGLSSVVVDKKWSYIDKTGKKIIDLALESAFEFRDGIALCKKDGKSVVIDRKGKVLWKVEPPLQVAFGVYDRMVIVKTVRDLPGQEPQWVIPVTPAQK